MSFAWYIACVLVVVSSPFKIVEIHTIQTRPNVIQIITMRRTNMSTSVLQRFVYWQERCAIFKDRKTNSSCFWMWYTIIRLLLNVSHVILQHLTFIARFISFIFHVCHLYVQDAGLFSPVLFSLLLTVLLCLDFAPTMLW